MSTQRRITKKEFEKKVMYALQGDGFSKKQRDEVKAAFRGDLYEKHHEDQGISEDELEHGLEWMRKNQRTHGLSDHKLEELESEMRKHL